MPTPPIYTRKQIIEAASSFYTEFNPRERIPVPIEVMVEKMGMEIYPVPGFREANGNRVAALNSDLASITIDERATDASYRFALAHEAGHFYLHREYIQQITPRDGHRIDTWRQWILTSSPESLVDLERQADIFARTVLLPDEAFREKLHFVESKLPVGQDWFSVTDAVFAALVESLCEVFATTSHSIEKRLGDMGITRD